MNLPVHFELAVSDPKRALSFYECVFGWKTRPSDSPQDYWLLLAGPDSDPGVIGGMMIAGEKTPRVVNTIRVDSVDETCRKIESCGGAVMMPKSAIPGVGWQAYCVDTEGIVFGVHQRDPHAK